MVPCVATQKLRPGQMDVAVLDLTAMQHANGKWTWLGSHFFKATITTEESVGTVRYILVYTYMVICHIYAHDTKTYLSKRKYLFQSQIWSFNSELQTELQTADDAQWPEGCHAEHSKSLLNYAILKLYLKPYSIIFVIINLCYSEIMWVWGVSYHKWESSRLTQTQTHSIAEKDQAW